MPSTNNYWDNIAKAKEYIAHAQAIIVGAGAGLSAAAGLLYDGERFQRLFPEFIEKYKLTDMYSSAFYPYKTIEEFWAYFSKHIYYNRYEQELNDTYDSLLSMIKHKNYFVITTNVDHIFQKSSFDKERLYYMQGDYGLLQCSVPCHAETYDNKELIYAMVQQQNHCKIPSALIPYCPKCGKPMTTNLRKDNTFVQDAGWYEAANRYECFIKDNSRKNMVFLELGVGYNTPAIIKFPFLTMTYQNTHAHYICINSSTDDLHCPQEIKEKSTLIHGDIAQVITDFM